MSEYTPRHSGNHHENEPDQHPGRRDDEPAIGFDPEHFPSRPGVWAADDSEAMTGQWIDATLEPDAIEAALDGRAIYDTIGFGSFVLEPGEDPEVISRVARGIQQHGPAFAAWAQLHDADPEMLATFTEHYLGTFASYEDLGRNLIEATGWSEGQIPEPIRPWVTVDYVGAVAHEADVSGLVLLPAGNGGVHLGGVKAWKQRGVAVRPGGVRRLRGA